jgi:hypothetical protein
MAAERIIYTFKPDIIISDVDSHLENIKATCATLGNYITLQNLSVLCETGDIKKYTDLVSEYQKKLDLECWDLYDIYLLCGKEEFHSETFKNIYSEKDKDILANKIFNEIRKKASKEVEGTIRSSATEDVYLHDNKYIYKIMERAKEIIFDRVCDCIIYMRHVSIKKDSHMIETTETNFNILTNVVMKICSDHAQFIFDNPEEEHHLLHN